MGNGGARHERGHVTLIAGRPLRSLPAGRPPGALVLLWVGVLTLHRPALAQTRPGLGAAPADSAVRASFVALKALAGTWTGTVKTSPTNPDLDGAIQVTMRVASHGNLLVHEIAPGGVPEPTMIYLEGDRLTLVHYCEAGNRPRLVARDPTDPETTDFELVDVSGSKSPLYLQRFVFTRIDADHHTEDWTFVLGGGKPLHAHFDLRRQRSATARHVTDHH